MDTEDRLVTIYRAAGQPEAEIIRGRLEIEGILTLLKYESIGSVYGLTVDGLGQVEVQVPARFSARAREIIESTGDEIEG